jgi:hypothetical protein
MRLQINRQKHPYYQHSEADFFLAVHDDEDGGRIALLENRHCNEYPHIRTAYDFEWVDDPAVAAALYGRALDWARQRKLNKIIGPKGWQTTKQTSRQVSRGQRRLSTCLLVYSSTNVE